ncbi:MAG: hypothetical protein LBD14_06660, partial [Puniceicoccales bacterium]|nr:hypothetical protein [Puniceicoccales bacterium]
KLTEEQNKYTEAVAKSGKSEAAYDAIARSTHRARDAMQGLGQSVNAPRNSIPSRCDNSVRAGA